MTRRDLLRSLGFVGAASALVGPAAAWGTTAKGARDLVSLAALTAPAGSDIGAIDHIVFLMMENRSYDHYFGAYPKGRGFDDHPADSLGVFAQSYPGGTSLNPPGVLLPFHLLQSAGEECTDDLTHDWGPQHLCWDNGKMDAVGDLTSTLGSTPNTSVPALPAPPVPTITLTGACSIFSQDTESGGASPDVPADQTMPTQQGTTVPATAYDTSAVSHPAPASRSDVLTAAVSGPGGRPMTVKSSYNRLAYTKE
jgi:hypothetical protein